MIVYFLRHANAGQPLANPKKDEKRALDKEGAEQCGIVGRALAALDVQVDVIISSPLKRAAQTASLVGNELSYEGKLQIEDALRYYFLRRQSSAIAIARPFRRDPLSRNAHDGLPRSSGTAAQVGSMGRSGGSGFAPRLRLGSVPN